MHNNTNYHFISQLSSWLILPASLLIFFLPFYVLFIKKMYTKVEPVSKRAWYIISQITFLILNIGSLYLFRYWGYSFIPLFLNSLYFIILNIIAFALFLPLSGQKMSPLLYWLSAYISFGSLTLVVYMVFQFLIDND